MSATPSEITNFRRLLEYTASDEVHTDSSQTVRNDAKSL